MQAEFSSAPADYSGRIYANAGNPGVVAMVTTEASTVLDVGCGAGDNAALLQSRVPAPRIFGITASQEESALARRYMEQVWTMDLEGVMPAQLQQQRFDCILCAHVLEHLRKPEVVVERLARLLNPGGQMVIAVPNVLHWRQRADFVAGRFEYASAGVMDETHLRFFTYDSAARHLLSRSPELRLTQRLAVGNVPLWLLRRKILSKSASAKIDLVGSRLFPNLFGEEVVFTAVKEPPR